MKNTFGNHITLTLFGESHGEAIGAVLDGLAPGIRIDNEYIAKDFPSAVRQVRYQPLVLRRTNIR